MGVTATLPECLRASVEKELAPDERVIWMEMPAAKFFKLKAVGTAVFAVPWTMFVLLFMYETTENGPQRAFTFFQVGYFAGIPFLVVGIFMLLAPVWSYLMARNTVYVVTDRRAVSFERGLGRMTVRVFNPQKLRNVFRREHTDGTGDVIVAFDEWTDMDGDRRREDLGFKHIRNPKHVEELLRGLSAKQ